MADLTKLSYRDPITGLDHWPDTLLGSELDYGVDWNDWLTNEGDAFVSMVWDALPTGLSSTYDNDSAGISIIQLSADSTGSYEVTGKMTSIESAHEQILPVKMHLKVT